MSTDLDKARAAAALLPDITPRDAILHAPGIDPGATLTDQRQPMRNRRTE